MEKLAISGLMVLLVILGSICGPMVSVSYADDANPGLFSADSQPFGISHAEWTGKWWIWFMNFPQDQHPAGDPTGERCMEGQNDPNVWFLAGAFEGEARRQCDIPSGVAILVPVITSMCSYVEYPDLKSEAELRQCAISTDNPADMGATIDGIAVKALRDEYSVTSPIFTLNYPENNIAGVNPGPSQGVSHFFSLFIKPLPIGNHELSFFQFTAPNPATGEPGFSFKVDYKIKIVPRNFTAVEQKLTIGNQSSAISINSSSTVTDFTFDEIGRKISFTVSESGPQGLTVVPLESVLGGPYTIMLDQNSVPNFRMKGDNDTGSTSVELLYPHGKHEVMIIGTSVVPEFGNLMIMLLVSLTLVLATTIYGLRKHHFTINY